MKAHEQRQYDALRTVDDFIVANASAVGALAESEGSKQVGSAISTINMLTNDQASADLNMDGLVSRKRAISAELKAQHMQPIATFARAKLRGVPDLAALTRATRTLEGAPLVWAARGMATAAAPYVDAFVRGGFPPDVITQLASPATALDDAMRERKNTKVGRVGATRGIREQLLSGREGVAMLHAVISRQFAKDARFIAAWSSARRVSGKVGALRFTGSSAAAGIIPPNTATTPTPAAAVGRGTAAQVATAA